MKAITLQRPWAAAFLLPDDPKRVENRKWKPPLKLIGQRIALHSGKGWWMIKPLRIPEGLQLRNGVEQTHWLMNAELMGVFATAKLAGYICTEGRQKIMTEAFLPGMTKQDAVNARDSRWYFGPVGWVLTDFQAVPTPISCKGAQGFWQVPDAVMTQVDAQLVDP